MTLKTPPASVSFGGTAAPAAAQVEDFWPTRAGDCCASAFMGVIH